jgi:hypothetical protein
MTYHAAGAIEDIGLAPYKIAGNPVLALLAQLNRFTGKTVKIGSGGPCIGARVYVPTAFPLVPVVPPRAADAAQLIVWSRYACVDPALQSLKKVAWTLHSDSWSWTMNNLAEITTTLAQVADGLGLEPATTGITAVDPKMKPKFPTMTVVLIGALAVAAVVVARRKS